MPESPDLSSTLQGNEPPKPEDPQPLKGYRRELTREVFEDLAALISQQYNRFLPPVKQSDAGAKAAIEALTAAVSLPEDDVREVFI